MSIRLAGTDGLDGIDESRGILCVLERDLEATVCLSDQGLVVNTSRYPHDDLLEENQEELSSGAGSGCRPLRRDTLPSVEDSGPMILWAVGTPTKTKMTAIPSLPKDEQRERDRL